MQPTTSRAATHRKYARLARICSKLFLATLLVAVASAGAQTSDSVVISLSWQRSTEGMAAVPFSPVLGGAVADAFALPLDPNQVVFDNGQYTRAVDVAAVPAGNQWASWPQWNGVCETTFESRHFRATFTLQAGAGPVRDFVLFSPFYVGQGDIIPVNDNLYVFLNGVRIGQKGTSYGAINGGKNGTAAFANETDGWYEDGSFGAAAVDVLREGVNTLDVVAEERCDDGGLGKLNLKLVLGASDDGWRMDGFNPSRTNRGTVAGPSVTVVPTVIADNVIGALRRVASDGTLLIAGGTAVSAYDASGAFKWQATLPLNVVDVAIGPEGHVYVSTATSLDAFDKESGAPVWPAPYVGNNGFESSSLALASDGTIFFHTGGFGERLSAVRADGSVKWETSLGFRGYTRVVLSKDGASAYLLQTKSSTGGPIGDVVRIDTATGAILGDTPCDPRGDVYAFTDSGFLLTGEINNRLLAFSPKLLSCTLIATGTTAVGIAALPPTGAIILNVFLSGVGYSFAAIDTAGNPLWSSTAPYKTNSLTAYQYMASDADGILYAISEDGSSVSAIDTSNGSVLWTQTFAAAVSGLLLGGDRNIYITSGSQLIRLSAPCPPPSITTQPFSQEVTSGQSVTLAVTATGTSPLTYQWYQGTSGDTSRPILGATSSSYSTGTLTATATYWVLVGSSCGQVTSSTATVSVKQPCVRPAITTQPSSQTVVSGQFATLTVSASGTSPLTYQWYQGNSGDTSNPISGATSAGYTTGALTTTTYWVRVGNSCGSTDSSTATVSITTLVSGGVKLLLSPSQLMQQIGDSAQFTATLTRGSRPVVGAPVSFFVTGANTQRSDSVTNELGKATFSYAGNSIGTDTVIASSPIVIRDVVSEASQVVWTGIELQPDTTTVYSKAHSLSRDALLWESFAREMLLLQDHEGGNLEQCTYDTVDVARELGATKFVNAALSELASGIFQASVGFNIGSPLGNILLKAGSYLFAQTAFGGSSISPLLVTKAATESTVGYILGKATAQFLADPFSGQLSNKFIDKLIKDSGAVYVEGDGFSLNSLTSAKVSLFYSPDTYFIVGFVGSSCSTDRYIFRYKVDASAVPTSPLTMLTISIDGTRHRVDYTF
jgi:hypothetical protein